MIHLIIMVGKPHYISSFILTHIYSIVLSFPQLSLVRFDAFFSQCTRRCSGSNVECSFAANSYLFMTDFLMSSLSTHPLRQPSCLTPDPSLTQQAQNWAVNVLFHCQKLPIHSHTNKSECFLYICDLSLGSKWCLWNINAWMFELIC